MLPWPAEGKLKEPLLGRKRNMTLLQTASSGIKERKRPLDDVLRIRTVFAPLTDPATSYVAENPTVLTPFSLAKRTTILLVFE